MQDEKGNFKAMCETHILEWLWSLNGKPAAWPFEGIVLTFFLQAISRNRMAFSVGFFLALGCYVRFISLNV